ncbi:MAG TPA: thiamine pyrophosphate-dependent enzyme [Acidobacteriota bacterium]|nr:thiamine pyrophosphate-dependent enzyme [Acidobacteriota bacterium]
MSKLHADFDWKRAARLILTSRRIDEVEETRLVPEKEVLYQFSARGHELIQVLLGSLLDHSHDAVSAYYRSRPLLLTLGVDLEDALAGPLMRTGGYSGGRDIGVVCNKPSETGAEGQTVTVLPMSGDVGSQYTPAAGWAQASLYRRDVLKEKEWDGAITVVLGGEGSVATNGFWSCLTIATTLKLPLLFFIEDNGYAISVPGRLQTPGGNIAANLESFADLAVVEGDGTDPADCPAKIKQAVDHVRGGAGPALIRLTVPRLSGHSGQDTQAYKSSEELEQERQSDPLERVREALTPSVLSEEEWESLQTEVEESVERALERALARPQPEPSGVRRHLYAEQREDGSVEVSMQGGLAAEGHEFPASSHEPKPQGNRLNMLTAIRMTLEAELKSNDKLLIFGEDVGPKGGVHAATMGLQEAFGPERVFDTSLSEEGIIGRSVGMAIAGLMPVAEIQFRKYADPAAEQLNNLGTLRWRTNNRFAAPILVRMPGGYFKCGDPWHSVSGEVLWAHAPGWQVAMPSNAQDAVGLLRAAMRSPNPTIFFEHRYLLDAPVARRPYPGDDYLLPLGQAAELTQGDQLTIVTWGAMVERCLRAAEESGKSCHIIDLRTISPWDKNVVLESVRRTMRCLIVHEDGLTAGFGAEIAAVLIKEAFFRLDAPIERMAVPDLPIPHNVGLMNAILPGIEDIAKKIVDLAEF